ncbi:MAG: ribonuclease PH [Armatimonadetes bacterium]|nr:ribonuclease PH [Armatimonadota bacterium]
MARSDGRQAEQLRPWSFEVGFAPYAEGSVLTRSGDTAVLCAATVEDRVPVWMADQNRGWVTAEYSMLPRSTLTRTRRDQARTNGRTHEIQRLIARSLRAVTDLQALGTRQIILDCDVLQADAGTRTAAITGSWIALALACHGLRKQGRLQKWPLKDQVAAVSLGIRGERILLDLNYGEDAGADVDLNLVMTSAGRLVEVQGTAEDTPFTTGQLNAMIELGWQGLEKLFEMQRQTVAAAGVPV